MKSSVYIRVAILFLAAAVIFYWGLNYLKGKDLFSSERTYLAVYEKVGGLTKSGPVTINGFQIGQVQLIQLSEADPGRIIVKFAVTNKSVKVPKGSTARIYSIDLMGTKGIALDLASSPELCRPNDTLAGTIEGDLRDQVNAQMLPFKMKVEDLMSSMDSVLTGIRMVFSERNRNNLTESFSSINQTLNNLETASTYLDDFIRNASTKIDSVLGRVDTLALSLLNRTYEIKGFIGNLNRFSDTLAHVPLITTFNAFRETLENLHDLTRKLSEGEGTLGKLLVNDSLYTALLATNGSLNRLIEDIRIHPEKYIQLSLSNKGKTVYAVNDTELARALAGEGTSEYYLCVLESPTPLAPDNLAIMGLRGAEYIQIGSLYYYYTYQNKSIEPCLKRLDKVRKNNPSAGIFTWVNGKWKRLNI